MGLMFRFVKCVFYVLVLSLLLTGCSSDNKVVLDKTTMRLSSLDSFETGDRSRHVVKDGSYIYVANREQGLLVLDVSNNVLSLVTTLNLNGEGEDSNAEAYVLTIVEDFIYVAAQEEGLLTVDVSTPASPELVDTDKTENQGVAYSVTSADDKLYLCSFGGLTIFDISDPGNPVSMGTYTEDTLILHHCVVEGNYVYAASESLFYGYSFSLFDISDFTEPRLLGIVSANVPSSDPDSRPTNNPVWAVAKRDNYLIVGSEGSGLLIYDSQNTEQEPIKILDTLDASNQSGQKNNQIILQDQYAYIADGENGIVVVNIRDVANPYIVERMETGGEVTGIFVDEDYLVAADETTGVHLFKISEVADSDSDGAPDDEDVFPLDGSETTDTDSDGVGNNTDTDDDGDEVLDADDAFPLDGSETTDTDRDGVGNNADTDDDGDEVLDADDAFPLDATETTDTDSDGVGDNADADDDGDGRTDTTDSYPLDTDNDGVENADDTDDDDDGVLDTADAFPLDEEEWEDLNEDGIGDNFPENRFAVIVTSMGTIKLELFEDLVPITTKNFIRLANDGYYDGIIFHRVIDDFMIQGGDPLGTGSGNPGYNIIDEFPRNEDDELLLTHEGAGVLSMANTGAPDSGGSQFFITLVATAWLDGAHTVFGRVVEGLDVLQAIGDVEIDSGNKPLTDVVMESVTIVTE